MHPHRLHQLVASVPEELDPSHRTRLRGHVHASDACRARIERARAELRRALDDGEDPERALDLACELDGLERVQQRLDGWLTMLVDELAHGPRTVRYDDGVPA